MSAVAVVSAARRQGRVRSVGVCAVLVPAIAVAVCASVSIGTFPVPAVDVVPSILGFGPPDAELVVHSLRLPRALAALLVGLALGASGTVFQSIARNELASPDIIGITAGAGTAAVLAIVVVRASSATIAAAALLGALATAFAVYLLAWKRGLSEYRLILVGIGMAALLGALTAYLLTRSELLELQRATLWLTGDLSAVGWSEVRTLTVAVVVLVPALLLLTRTLRALVLGDDAARGIGVRVETGRALVIACACGLAAFAVAAAGPITFVAFIAGPIARRLVRTGDAAIVPAALTGAVLLLAADLLARAGPWEAQLPVGVLTGILGAPYFVWLLVRTNKAGIGD